MGRVSKRQVNPADLADLEAKHLLKVGGLADEQQVEGPAAAEVGHDDGVDGHGGEEGPPGGVELLQRHTDVSASLTLTLTRVEPAARTSGLRVRDGLSIL